MVRKSRIEFQKIGEKIDFLKTDLSDHRLIEKKMGPLGIVKLFTTEMDLRVQ